MYYWNDYCLALRIDRLFTSKQLERFEIRMFRRRMFGRETFCWCRLDARRLDTGRFNARHLDAGLLDLRHLKGRCLNVRYLDARRLDVRHLLTRILDTVVWTSDVWMSKERCPNIMYRSLDADVTGTLRLDDAVSTETFVPKLLYFRCFDAAVWTQDIWTPVVSTWDICWVEYWNIGSN